MYLGYARIRILLELVQLLLNNLANHNQFHPCPPLGTGLDVVIFSGYPRIMILFLNTYCFISTTWPITASFTPPLPHWAHLVLFWEKTTSWGSDCTWKLRKVPNINSIWAEVCCSRLTFLYPEPYVLASHFTSVELCFPQEPEGASWKCSSFVNTRGKKKRFIVWSETIVLANPRTQKQIGGIHQFPGNLEAWPLEFNQNLAPMFTTLTLGLGTNDFPPPQGHTTKCQTTIKNLESHKLRPSG